MRAGQLIERIAFYAMTVTRDAYNAATESYTKTIDTRAGVTYLSGDKTLSSDEKFFSGTVFFNIRYRAGITESMQIEWRGDKYAISYIQEVGYKDSLRITASKINE